jgi:hypothetical protein
MFEWSTFWLILHILTVMFALGPAFVFAIIGASAQKEPQHALFAVRLTHTIEKRLVQPVAALVPFTGLGVVVTRRYDFWGSTFLVVVAALFTLNYAFAFFVQGGWSRQMESKLEALQSGTAGPETPQEMMALGKKLRFGGMLLTLILITMVVLMIWRPGAEFLPPP